MVKIITKESIAELPIARFDGRIIVVNTEQDAEKAVAYLKQFKAVGFDTETRPSFKKGKSHKIALMQLSTEDTCFLFRLSLIGFPDCLKSFLSDNSVKKIGLSIKDDFSVIRRSVEINPEGFVELQKMTNEYGIEENGLQRIYAILFGEKISKRQRLTNWEAETLSESQQMYAALDASACLKIYNKLIERKSLNP